MRVAELMRRDFVVVRRDDSVETAARAMAENDSDVVLIEGDDRLAGVLTDRDLLIRVVAVGRDPSTTPLWQVMSSDLFTCAEEDEAASVAEEMAAHGIGQMPVVDAAGRPVGLITREAALRMPSPGPEL
jgi:CBS domain-containing protein